MDKALCSIVIPVYNRENFISDCLNSVRAQDYANLEIIIVNDGSTDKSKDLCEKFVMLDTRFRLINQKNSGVSAARNTGISVSNGEYVMFVDSDDTLETNFVSKMYETMQKELVDLVICNYNIVDKVSKTKKQNNVFYNAKISPYILFNDYWKYYYGGYINAPWNKLYNLKKIKDLGFKFPEDIKMGEDGYFNVRYISECKDIYVINDYLYNMNIHPGQATSKVNVIKNYYNMALKIYDNIERNFIKFEVFSNLTCKKKFYIEYLNEIKVSFKYILNDDTLKYRNKFNNIKKICVNKRTLSAQRILHLKEVRFKDQVLLIFIRGVMHLES